MRTRVFSGRLTALRPVFSLFPLTPRALHLGRAGALIGELLPRQQTASTRVDRALSVLVQGPGPAAQTRRTALSLAQERVRGQTATQVASPIRCIPSSGALPPMATCLRLAPSLVSSLFSLVQVNHEPKVTDFVVE